MKLCQQTKAEKLIKIDFFLFLLLKISEQYTCSYILMPGFSWPATNVKCKVFE